MNPEGGVKSPPPELTPEVPYGMTREQDHS